VKATKKMLKYSTLHHLLQVGREMKSRWREEEIDEVEGDESRTSGSWRLHRVLSSVFLLARVTLQQTQQDRIVFYPPSVALGMVPFQNNR